MPSGGTAVEAAPVSERSKHEISAAAATDIPPTREMMLDQPRNGVSKSPSDLEITLFDPRA